MNFTVGEGDEEIFLLFVKGRGEDKDNCGDSKLIVVGDLVNLLRRSCSEDCTFKEGTSSQIQLSGL